MITKNMKDKIRDVKELEVTNTNSTRYRFDPKTNTLYIPIFENDFSRMFQGCTKLEKIKFFINNKIKNVQYMFWCCISLKEVTFYNSLNLSDAEQLCDMFSNCNSIEELDLSNMITSEKLINIASMFIGCISLRNIYFGKYFYSENIENASYAFSGCRSLENIYWREYQPFNNLGYMNSIFGSCEKLQKVDLRGINFNNIHNMCNAFSHTNPGLKVYVNSTFRK